MKNKKAEVMERILCNVWLLVGFAGLVVGVSFLASCITGKWHWFGRAGAIATMMGVILSIRSIVRKGLDEWVQSQNTIDGGGAALSPEDIEEERQERLDAKAAVIGVIMVLAGTIVWAYGDLIGGLP